MTVKNIAQPDAENVLNPVQYLNWINRQADLNYDQIEDLSDAIGYCVLTYKLYPKSILFRNVCKENVDKEGKRNNWKILKVAFEKLQVKNNIDEKRYAQANEDLHLNFIQWFKEFYDKNKEELEKASLNESEIEEKVALQRVTSTLGVVGVPSFLPQAIDTEFKNTLSKLQSSTRNGNDDEKILDAAQAVKAAHLLNITQMFENMKDIDEYVSSVNTKRKSRVSTAFKDIKEAFDYLPEVSHKLNLASSDVEQNETIIQAYHLMTLMKTTAGMIYKSKKYDATSVPVDMLNACVRVIQGINRSVDSATSTLFEMTQFINQIPVPNNHKFTMSFRKLKSLLKEARKSAQIVRKTEAKTFQSIAENSMWYALHWAKVTADAILFIDSGKED